MKIEPDDQHKATIIHPGFRDPIEAKRADGRLGGFVFHFGNGFDHTGLSLSLRVDGLRRPQYWATARPSPENPPTTPCPRSNFSRSANPPSPTAPASGSKVGLSRKGRVRGLLRRQPPLPPLDGEGRGLSF